VWVDHDVAAIRPDTTIRGDYFPERALARRLALQDLPDTVCLGTFSLPRQSREGSLFLDAVEHAQRATPDHPSIVQGSVAAAVRGDFGDVRFTEHTKDSEPFTSLSTGSRTPL
jgi:hypothetical protein